LKITIFSQTQTAISISAKRERKAKREIENKLKFHSELFHFERGEENTLINPIILSILHLFPLLLLQRVRERETKCYSILNPPCLGLIDVCIL
jgi:hypothetical protein